MKAASAAVITLLSSGLLVLRADLFTFTLPDGTVVRWSSCDRPFTIGANTWSVGPLIKRSNTKQRVGIEVDTINVNIQDNGTFMVGVRPLMQKLQEGEFDGALVQVDKLFLSDWNDLSPGAVPWFTGYVSEVTAETGDVELRIKSLLGMLDVPMPKALYMPPCNNTFGEAACGKSLASLTGTGTVGSGATDRTIPLSGAGVTKADGYYSLGVIKFTSGAYTNISRTVRLHASNVATISPALPTAPAVGDGIAVYPSCLKTRTACVGYVNEPNYRGFPFVPSPDTLYGGGASTPGNGSQGGSGQAPAGSGGGGTNVTTNTYQN